jgi:predicted O-methyltransferase YrrM
VRENVELHVGWFDATLPEFKTKHGNTPLQLLHIDSDLYSSAVTILETLKDNIVPGTVIVFDEYLNYPGWELDEFKAWQEHVAKYKIKYEYIGRVSKHQKVAVRVL